MKDFENFFLNFSENQPLPQEVPSHLHFSSIKIKFALFHIYKKENLKMLIAFTYVKRMPYSCYRLDSTYFH